LKRARGLGEPADRALISDVLAIHKEYLLAIDRMFAAVDAGDITRANELDRTDVDPKFDIMELRFLRLPTLIMPRLCGVWANWHVQTSVLAVTICAFAIGIGLVILFEFIHRAQRRRADDAKAHEPSSSAKMRIVFRALMRQQYERFNAA
jgi:hypothetical protein